MWLPGRTQKYAKRRRKRNWRRLAKGVLYGFVGALAFLAIVFLMYLGFEIADPYLSEAAARVFESPYYDRLEAGFGKVRVVVGRYV